MTPKFEFFDHTADIGVRVSGATLRELFVNAGCALYTAMGALRTGGERRERRVDLRAESQEDLLHDWLTELLYEVGANGVIFDEMEITAIESGRLSATLCGGGIDFDSSELRTEIKAVTYHQLHVEKLTDGFWRAIIILDV